MTKVQLNKANFLKDCGFSSDAKIASITVHNTYEEAFYMVYVLDNNEVQKVYVSGTSDFFGKLCYNHKAYVDEFAYEMANEIYRLKNKQFETRYEIKYLGCEVILKRSRKAPNGVPLEVVNFSHAYHNGYFPVAEQICVKVGDEFIWVNSSCVKEVVKGMELPTV